MIRFLIFLMSFLLGFLVLLSVDSIGSDPKSFVLEIKQKQYEDGHYQAVSTGYTTVVNYIDPSWSLVVEDYLPCYVNEDFYDKVSVGSKLKVTISSGLLFSFNKYCTQVEVYNE